MDTNTNTNTHTHTHNFCILIKSQKHRAQRFPSSDYVRKPKRLPPHIHTPPSYLHNPGYMRTDLCTRSRCLLEQSLRHVLDIVRGRVRFGHVQTPSKDAGATRRRSARSASAAGDACGRAPAEAHRCCRAEKARSGRKRIR